MQPPALAIKLSVNLLSDRLYERENVLEWCFIKRGFTYRHINPEVDDPHVTSPAGDIKTIHPRTNYIAIWPPVGIEWRAQPFGCLDMIYVELATLHVAYEPDIQVFP